MARHRDRRFCNCSKQKPHRADCKYSHKNMAWRKELMEVIITAIKDIKAGVFAGSTVHVRSEAEAQRHFLAMLGMSDRTTFHQHPKDFHMYRLGKINIETGEITPELPTDITPHSQVDKILNDRELDKRRKELLDGSDR